MSRDVLASARRAFARVVLPRGFLRARRDEMEATFQALLTEARERGGRGAAYGLLARELVDLARAGFQLRRLLVARRLGSSMSRVRGMRRALASGLAGDVLLASRSLVRRPTWAGLAVVTVGLGVGGGTAMFTVVDGVLLEPLPYPAAERLAHVFLTNPELGWDRGPVSFPNFDDWRRREGPFESLAAWQRGLRRGVRVGEATRLVQGSRVSGELFATLGVAPAEGRWIDPSDEASEGEAPVVLSHELRVEVFGEGPAIGRRLELGDEVRTVVGVMPQDFAPLHPTDRFWVPFPWRAGELERDMSFLAVIGRLRPGVTLEEARSSMEAMVRAIEAEAPEGNRGRSVNVVSRVDMVTGPVRRPLTLLLGAVCLLLAIAAANLAGISLARAADRGAEMSVRRALGAGRTHLLRLLAVEAGAVGLMGAAVAAPVAVLGLDALLGAAPTDLPRRAAVALDGGSLLFGAAVLVALTLAFAAAPALLGTPRDPSVGLTAAGRGSTGASRVQRLLVVGQVSVALVLLAGAGLLSTSLWRLARTDSGFESRGVLTFRLHPPDGAYQAPGELDAVYERIEASLRALPGVEAVGATWALPYGDAYASSSYRIEGRPGGGEHLVQIIPVRGDYFDALGISPLRGRLFGPADSDAPQRIIVNETLAARAWPGQDPVGRRLVKDEDDGQEVVEVVGVVPDVAMGVGEAPLLQSYWPHRTTPWARELYFSVRTSPGSVADPATLVPAVRSAIARVDERMPVADVATMAGRRHEQMAEPRFRAVVVGAFAGLSAVLVLIGVYGVTAMLVARRRRAIGVRMALGADRGTVLAGVLGEGARLAIAGALLGLMGALAASRTLEGLLFDVDPLEPSAYVGATAAVLAVALLAAWLPARRAGRVDPLEALRAD